MTNFKTTQKTYFFAAPFTLEGFEHSFPAGRYNVETEEEVTNSMSYVACKRVATTMRMIHTPETFSQPRTLNDTYDIDPRAFSLAVLRDRHQCADEAKETDVQRSDTDQIALDASVNEGMPEGKSDA